MCDESTWLALVEASWKLGDRWLKLSSPYLRGDDVDQLQTALARLGFDCGRPDGIYGPLTVRAVQRFQRNSGVHSDGVCGPDTVRLLMMNSRQTGDGPGVAMLREISGLTTLRHGGEALRIVVGQFGGLSALTRQVSRALRHRAANVLTIDEPDPAAQAAVANRHRSTAYLGFEASTDERCTVSYFAAPPFESMGGRVLAEQLSQRISADVKPPLGSCAQGMRLAVLRETKMPAVLCSLWPIHDVLAASPLLADVVAETVVSWDVARRVTS